MDARRGRTERLTLEAEDEALALELARVLVAVFRRCRCPAAESKPEAPKVAPVQVPAVPAASLILSEADAAMYTGFSRAYFRKARQFGRGPAFLRVGRTIRYRIPDLDSWLATHRVRGER
jgi:hypothetical protein